MAKYNVGSGLQGAISGGSVGSAFGPIGTGVGALVGAVGGLFGSKKKKRKKPKPLTMLDPQQQALYGDYVSSLRGQGPFADMYNFNTDQANQVFDQTTARPAYRGFRENIIPQITGQYRQGNIMNSSYSADALSRAGRDVQENLDALRASQMFQGQQQSQQNKQNAIQNVLGTTTFGYQNPKQQSQPGMIDQILGSVGPRAGEWLSDYLKGFMGGKKEQ